MVLKENGNVIASGSDIATNLTVNDQVTIDGNVITRINTAADRNAAEAVDTQIAALSIADETAPTTAERLAITSARAAYTGLTAAQKALVTKLGALETLEAVITVVDGPAVADAAAVKAVKDAVAENDKAKFITALNNVLFTKYVAANNDAYWAAKGTIAGTGITTVALMDAELLKVNDLAPLTALKAATTKTEFIAALKNAAFTDYKVANDDAYWTAEATIRSGAVTTVALANAQLVIVNDVEAMKVAKAALTNASLTMVDATTDPVVVNAPVAHANGATYTITAKADTTVTTTIAGDAKSASIARSTGGSTILTVTITKGAATDTVTYTVTVPAATGAATIVKN